MINYLGNTTFNSKKISKGNDSRILIIDAEIGEDPFALIILYNLTLKLKNYKIFLSFTSCLKMFVRLYRKYYFCGRFQLMFWVNVRKFRIKYIVKKQICLKHFTNLYKVWSWRYLENKKSVIEMLYFQKKSFLGFHTKKIKFRFYFKLCTRINQKNWHSSIIL